MRKWLTFNFAVWLLALAVAAWLLGGPIIMNFWAAKSWNCIDCHLDPNGGFYYRVEGKKYSSNRTDFWLTNKDARPREDWMPDLENNAKCWVNPSDPLQAVLKLDAPTNWTNSFGKVVPAVLILIGAGVLTFFGRSKRAKGQPS